MASVAEHYRTHLAPIYEWMLGGFDAALAAAAEDLAELLPGRGHAVDLGAGFGAHSVALARGGYSVTAIDLEPQLLRRLEERAAGLPVRAVPADLLDFRAQLAGPVDLAVCLGDTLTHLADLEQVHHLCHELHAALAPGGRFVATFRDYTTALRADARFIPVRADADRILTCFIEEEAAGHVVVHDLLHERTAAGWRQRVSHYRKLRLPAAELEQALRRAGFSDIGIEPARRGMLRALART